MAEQQFCLRWNNHQKTIVSVFDSLLEGEILVDCTLAAEGQFLRAHKVVLSACSPFFSDLLREHYEKHPILIMKDVKFSQLKAMLDYMYRGEVNISQDELGTFLKAAESLQIKGLSDSSQNCDSASKPKASPPVNRTLRSALRAPNDDSAVPRSKSTSPTPRKRKRRLHSESGEDIVTEDSASEPVLESNMSVPIQTNVNSITVKTSPQREDENSSLEAPGLNSNHVLSSSVSISFKNGSPRHHPHSLDSSLSAQQNSEFLDVDNVEDLTLDDGNVEAGPSHSSSEAAGFTWHVDRPSDENFLSAQDSHGGYRNAQGDGISPMCDLESSWLPESNIQPTASGPGAVHPTNDTDGATPYDETNYFLDDGSTLSWAASDSSHNCPKCGKSYQHKGSLSRHLRVECGKLRSEMCAICRKSFLYKHHLDRHMKFVHNIQ